MSSCYKVYPLSSCSQTKCHRYWPGTDPSVYGDIAVELISEKEKEDWTVREFKLSAVSVWREGMRMVRVVCGACVLECVEGGDENGEGSVWSMCVRVCGIFIINHTYVR